MANKFDQYRKVKKEYGGRLDRPSTILGWGTVLLVFGVVFLSWWYAIQGYRKIGFTPTSNNQAAELSIARDRNHRSGQDNQISRPGLLVTERAPEELAVVFLDVGQGDAIFLRTPMKENILIDSGEGTNPDFKFARQVDAANQLILPFFKRNRIDHLDYFITTHPHSDHIGGASDIVENISIGTVWIAGMEHPSPSKRDLLTAVKNKKDQTGVTLKKPAESGGTLKEGQKLRFQGSLKGWLLRTNPYAENVNRASLVTMFRYGETSFLFTGDTEKPGEYELTKKWGDQLDVDVLKVGHHGSKTSTIKPFVDTVEPDHSVIMVGHYNTFGHPTPDVLRRLKRVGSEIHRTDRDGTIYMFSDGEKIRVIQQQAVSAVND